MPQSPSEPHTGSLWPQPGPVLVPQPRFSCLAPSALCTTMVPGEGHPSPTAVTQLHPLVSVLTLPSQLRPFPHHIWVTPGKHQSVSHCCSMNWLLSAFLSSLRAPYETSIQTCIDIGFLKIFTTLNLTLISEYKTEI